MSRLHNFSGGPAVLPESVIRETQDALWELEGSGEGLVETSHRGQAFEAVLARAKDRLRRLLRLSADQEVLLLHGGARTQFFQIPMNLLRGARATYLDTGIWAAGAIEEAGRYGAVDVPFSSRAQRYNRVPSPGEWGPLPENTRYLHYTSNNTVAGTEFHYVPDPGPAWLVADMSSNILSRPVDGSKFDLIYAGAQKNLGPSGVTLVVIRKELIERCDTDIPMMCRYGVHAANDSMFNTPCTFAIYVVERVCAWIEAQGGVEAVERRNVAQAEQVYAVIDGSGFWQGRAEVGSRSRMNLTFGASDPSLDARFVAEATAAGLQGLKGHRSVGGMRASLYNAQTDEAVKALVEFMQAFEARNG